MDLDATSGYEFIDHTADVVVRAWGPGPEQVFEQAGLAMLSLLYDPASVDRRETFALVVEASDRELLLAAWLNELLYQVEGRRRLFATLSVERLTDGELWVAAAGEVYDRRRHHVHGVVKAATLHDLSLRRTAVGWEGRVLLDV